MGANLDVDERWAAQSAADCKPDLHHLMELLRNSSRISGANQEQPEFIYFSLKATKFQLMSPIRTHVMYEILSFATVP